ncbi:MAG TPA: hypothetical protein VM581_00245 [Magnetospirillaceae bacterium]|nr:hypothetical protein [Magnetospirillaceae bacterium]
MFIPHIPASTAEAVVTGAYLVAVGVQYACDVLLIKRARKMPAKQGGASVRRSWLLGLLMYALGVVGLALCLVTLCHVGRAARYHNFVIDTWFVVWQQIVGLIVTAVFVLHGLWRSRHPKVSL